MAEFEKRGQWKPDGTSTGEMPRSLREKSAKDEREEETQQEPHQQDEAANEASEGVVTPKPVLGGHVVWLPISRIRPSSFNPNTRTADQIKDLARNIKRWGQINAIRVRPLDGEDHDYEIESGEGRWLAYQHLLRYDKNLDWSLIKAVIIDDENLDEIILSGRRLSENRMRSATWASECIELARLKSAGMKNKDLEQDFGLGKSSIANMIAVGATLERISIAKEMMVQLTGTLTRQQFIDWILPLRVPPKKAQAQAGTQGFQRINPDEFDYGEVESCVGLLLSGDLSVEELEEYSLAHRPQQKPSNKTSKKTSKKSAPASPEEEEEIHGKKRNLKVVVGDEQENDQLMTPLAQLMCYDLTYPVEE